MSSQESITTRTTSDNSFTQKLTCNHNSKIAVKIEGNCLNQDKTFFTHRNVVHVFMFMN